MHKDQSFEDAASFAIQCALEMGDSNALELFQKAKRILPSLEKKSKSSYDNSFLERWLLRCCMKTTDAFKTTKPMEYENRLRSIAFGWTILGFPSKAAQMMISLARFQSRGAPRTVSLLKVIL